MEPATDTMSSQINVEREEDSAPSSCCAVAVLAYVGWFLFGCFTGGHWGVIACHSREAKDRTQALAHMFKYWVLVGVFIGFRWPLPSWSTDCTDNSTMSQDCLFHDEPTKYATFYVIHIFILVFTFTCFIAEGFRIPQWTQAALAGEPKYMCACCNVTYEYLYLLVFAITSVIMIIWGNVDWTIG
ncbi:hypothetical protein DIPPA_28921 [Diplonema papillatum]|nr:hypothetical protein DIPPA_28921 [Diplonema papillatum]|eukprot:gene11205-17231_t